MIICSSPVLVSRTRTGNAKSWVAHVVREANQWFTQTSYWQTNAQGKDSVVQWSAPYEALPKNVGRANVTTAEVQARAEWASMVQKQRDKGYTEVGTVSTIRPLPMLAHKFVERGTKMQWPVQVQPKYNGQRMLFDGTTGWSRGGKEILPAVVAHLQCVLPPGTILDGELLLPRNVLLQDTMVATKKFRPGISEQLLYIVYDLISPLVFSERFRHLARIHAGLSVPNLHLAPTQPAIDAGEVMTFHRWCTGQGFEGVMIRDDSGGYEIGHRSNQLQKYKEFQDDEFVITDVVEGDGKFKGSAVFVCVTAAGRTFNCTPEGNMKYRQDLYRSRQTLVGRKLTIRYQELSNLYIPLFPVGVVVQD